MKNTIAVLLAVAALVVACTHQVSKPSDTGNGNNGEDTSGNRNNLICFEGQILPLFQSTCAKSGCHDALSHEEGYVLDSYANITSNGINAGNANDSKIYEVIIEGEMPPAGNAGFTSDQVALIAQWINEGALNTANCNSCDTSVYSYSAAVNNIMSTHCTGCHGGSFPSAGIDLSNYNGVQAVAASGQLMGAVTHATGYAPMPQGGNQLSECEITQLQKWVDSGTPSN